MAADFYHKWLGIPPEEQPPDHYRLLAVRRFESDVEVIQMAAELRLGHLRTFLTGEQSADAARLVRRVEEARICLLDPASKTAYDERLRAYSNTATPAPSLPAAPVSPRSTEASVVRPVQNSDWRAAMLPPGNHASEPASPSPAESEIAHDDAALGRRGPSTRAIDSSALFAASDDIAAAAESPVVNWEQGNPKPLAVTAHASQSNSAASQRKKKQFNPLVELVKIVGGGLVGIALGYLIVIQIRPEIDVLHWRGRPATPADEASAGAEPGTSASPETALRPATGDSAVAPPADFHPLPFPAPSAGKRRPSPSADEHSKPDEKISLPELPLTTASPDDSRKGDPPRESPGPGGKPVAAGKSQPSAGPTDRTPPVRSAENTSALPPPAPAEQLAAAERLKETFLNSPPGELLQAARSETDAARRYVLFSAAIKRSADAGEAQETFAAILELSTRFQIDLPVQKVAAVRALKTTCKDKRQAKELAAAALGAADQANLDQNKPLAKEMLLVALAAARTSGDQSMVRDITLKFAALGD